ncbi:MAG: nitrilase-related carbon-nitrogen hydrolase [Gemmatimonadota bacterium]|nr:nitrilase-related carbon-nitrogen hydrolase [Gemmatimonadota bacterium]
MTRVALIQQTAGPDRSENLKRGLAALDRAADRDAHVACFAELAFDPFHPQIPPDGSPLELAETVPGPTTEALAARAAAHGLVVIANLLEKDGERAYDASPVIDADGALLGVTRMVHVPDYDGFHEKRWYAPGDRGAPVYDTAAGRIGVAICYDRHYPEYMRALALAGAELVVVPQAGAVDEWPEGLFEAEMRTAAFQNGYFLALCNRVGEEERLTFAGESFVSDPGGVVVARAPELEETILFADLDLAEIERSHARRLFLPDRRPQLYPEWLDNG